MEKKKLLKNIKITVRDEEEKKEYRWWVDSVLLVQMDSVVVRVSLHWRMYKGLNEKKIECKQRTKLKAHYFPYIRRCNAITRVIKTSRVYRPFQF